MASEETEPVLGWAYAGFLGEQVNNPGMGPDQLAAIIVDTYIDQDVVLSTTRPALSSCVRAPALALLWGAPGQRRTVGRQLERNITLTAVISKRWAS